MKKLLLVLISFLLFPLISFASGINTIDTRVNDIDNKIIEMNSLISSFESKKNLLTQEKLLLKAEYDKSILDAKNALNSETQQTRWSCNKYGLTCNTKAIEDKWNKLIDGLELELKHNLGVKDDNINDYSIKISEYKSEIFNLNKEKSSLLNEKKDIDNKMKSYSNNIKIGDTYYRNNDYKNAITFYKISCDLGNEYGDMYICNFNIANSYIKLGKFNEAKSYLYKAIDNTDIYSKKMEAEDKIVEIKKMIFKNEERINNSKDEEGILNTKLEDKADIVFQKLENKLLNVNVNKKISIYNNIINKLKLYKDTSKNKNLIILIDYLITKMNNYIIENTNFGNDINNILNNK